MLTDMTAITDPLAHVFLIARIVQSCVHLASLSTVAVYLRFSAFVVQIDLAAYWAVKLLAG